MSFRDVTVSRESPTTGTGHAASAALVRISHALVRAMHPPLNQGCIAECHVGIELAGGKGIDVNFGKHAAEALMSQRFAEVHPFIQAGMSLDTISAMMMEQRGDVPLGCDLEAAATFEPASGTHSVLPLAARTWYTDTLDAIPDAHLDLAISMLENATHVGCVPLAILKERKGVGKAIVGKLGFRHPGGREVVDWEFGGNGIFWH